MGSHRRWLATSLFTFFLAGGVGSAVAAPTTVTIEAGPSEQRSFAPGCTDALTVIDEATSFVVTRDGTAGTLMVAYTASGSAQSGVHYEPLPGEVEFADGEATANIEVTPKANDDGGLVELTLTLDPDGVAVGDPGSASIRFATEATNPGPCDYDFVLTDAGRNSRQVITVGEGLEPFELELELGGVLENSFGSPANSYRHELVNGSLPPGITIGCAPSSDQSAECFAGVPVGTATSVGTTSATIEICSGGYTFDCETTDLEVVVQVGSSGSGLPETGGGPPWVLPIAAGVTGSALLGLARHLRNRDRLSERAGR